MVSVTPASHYITSASRYHPRYQSRSSMYIRGLILRNFAELAEAVPIVSYSVNFRLKFFFGGIFIQIVIEHSVIKQW